MTGNSEDSLYRLRSGGQTIIAILKSTIARGVSTVRTTRNLVLQGLA